MYSYPANLMEPSIENSRVIANGINGLGKGAAYVALGSLPARFQKYFTDKFNINPIDPSVSSTIAEGLGGCVAWYVGIENGNAPVASTGAVAMADSFKRMFVNHLLNKEPSGILPLELTAAPAFKLSDYLTRKA